MLTIRDTQIRVLEADVEDDAVIASIGYLRSRYPAESALWENGALKQLIVRARGRARRRGFFREDNLVVFASLTLMYGEKFEDAQWASVLHEQALHQPDRIVLLRHQLDQFGIFV